MKIQAITNNTSFGIMLIPSALWMPLTNLYVGNPSTGLWIGIRTVLALVGLASIALVWALLSLQTRVPGISYWLAVAGSGYFVFSHCYSGCYYLGGTVQMKLVRQ